MRFGVLVFIYIFSMSVRIPFSMAIDHYWRTPCPFPSLYKITMKRVASLCKFCIFIRKLSFTIDGLYFCEFTLNCRMTKFELAR